MEDYIYGEINQEYVPIEYEGGTTSTVQVIVDNVSKTIYANAHLDDASIDSQIEEWVKKKLKYTDTDASESSFIYGIDEEAGKLTNYRRRSLSDLSLAELSKLASELNEEYVKKEAGKGLSTEDYTTEEKSKLAGIEDNANFYELPPATADSLGGVKVGRNLTVEEDGTLNAEAESVPIATVETPGIVKPDGETILVEEDGTIKATAKAQVQSDWEEDDPEQVSFIKNKPEIPTPYELPTASAEILGGVKVGENLSIDEEGVLSASRGNINFATFSIDPVTMELIAHWTDKESEEIIFTLNNKKELEVTIV